MPTMSSMWPVNVVPRTPTTPIVFSSRWGAMSSGPIVYFPSASGMNPRGSTSKYRQNFSHTTCKQYVMEPGHHKNDAQLLRNSRWVGLLLWLFAARSRSIRDDHRWDPAATGFLRNRHRQRRIACTGLVRTERLRQRSSTGRASVMPGIITFTVHLGNTSELKQDGKFYTQESVQKNLATYASYGVTTVFNSGTDQDLVFKIRDEQRARRPSVTRVYTAGQGMVFRGRIRGWWV